MRSRLFTLTEQTEEFEIVLVYRPTRVLASNSRNLEAISDYRRKLVEQLRLQSGFSSLALFCKALEALTAWLPTPRAAIQGVEGFSGHPTF